MQLLTRDEFRIAVMKRDGHKCIVCFRVDCLAVHHIIERKLFKDGGYYIDNGATLCPQCHILAEETEITCDEIREDAGIKKVVLPDGFDGNCTYDKWGNKIVYGIISEYNESTFDAFQKMMERKVSKYGKAH